MSERLPGVSILRIQPPCGSSCEDGPWGAPGSGWTEDAVRAGHVVAAAPVTLRRLRAPGSMSHRSPLDLILGRRGGSPGPWAVSTGQTRGELVPRGRALAVQGLEPTGATPKLAQLHRPVPASLSCVDTRQAFRTHSLGLEHGRGGPWTSEKRTVRTHLGSPAAPGPLPPHLFWAHLQRSPKSSGGSSRGLWRLVGLPAQVPSTMPRGHCSACPWGQGGSAAACSVNARPTGVRLPGGPPPLTTAQG